MESDSRFQGPAGTPTPAEAGEILDSLTGDVSRLAQRVGSPAWYYPAVGVAMAVFVSGRAFAPGAFVDIVLVHMLPLAVVAGAFVYMAAKRPSGFWFAGPRGRGSRRLLSAMIAVLVLASLAAVMIGLSEASPWWGVLPAVLAAAATAGLGPRYDSAFRRELARDVREGP